MSPHPPFVRHFVQRMRGTEEGEVFLGGIALTALLVIEVVLLLVFAPAYGRAIVSSMPVDAVSGKEASLPIAISGGAPWWLAAQVSALQHVALGALVFPLFLFVLHRYHDRDSLVMRRLRRIEAAAERHRAFVTRWGPLGVFLFMLVPFLVNGPLVGAVLGRVSGISSRYLAIPVVAATLVSTAAWAGGYHGIFSAADDVDPTLPRIIAFAVVGFAVTFALVDEYRQRRKEKAEAAAKPE